MNNPLTERMLADWERYDGGDFVMAELKEHIIPERGQVVKIEDVYYVDGFVDEWGGRIPERLYTFESDLKTSLGPSVKLSFWRRHGAAEPLEKNPLTLADVD